MYKEKLKTLSKVIYTLADDLKKGTNGSPELTKADNELKLAKAYVGKILGLIGEPTPYQNDGKRIDVKDIEKEANTDKVYYSFSMESGIYNENDTTVTKIDKCRQYIEQILEMFLVDYLSESQILPYLATEAVIVQQKKTMLLYTYSSNVTSHLTNAKIWLGFELGRIRNTEQK